MSRKRNRTHNSFFGPATLVELLRHRAEYQPDAYTYKWLVDGEDEEQIVTNAELDRQARAIAARLQQMGLTGQQALLLYPPGLEFVAAFFGCLYAGVVAVPAYPPRMNRSLERIQAIVEDSQAQVAMTVSSVYERVEPRLDQTPDLAALPWLSTDQLPAGIENQWRNPAIGPDTLAFLQYTSGSTGTPKGVMLTHGNLIHNSALICYTFEHTRSNTGVFWLPSYHDMGLIGGILQPLYVGRPNVLMSPMAFLQRPIRWLRAITRHQGSTSGGPNFAYDLCLSKISDDQLPGLDLSSWQVAFNGAEPIREETLRNFTDRFAPYGFNPEAFYPCYGMAESTLIITGGLKHEPVIVLSADAKGLETGKVVAPQPEGDVRRLIGCGKALPDGDVRIVDPETLRELPDGQVGEIWAASPSVAVGYWRKDELTEEYFDAKIADSGEGPFMRTGDLGFLQDGELFVTGRLKDLIIIRGMNHYPQDIELTVQRIHPALRTDAAAAFSVQEGTRELLIIVQEIERRQVDAAEEALEAIRKAVSQEHDLTVDRVLLIKAGSIPKTSSGKIQRHACRNGFLEGTLTVVAEREWSGLMPKPQQPAAPKTSQPAKTETFSQPDNGHAEPAAGLNGNGSHKPAAALANLDQAEEVVLDAVRQIGRERAAGVTLETAIADIGFDSLERIELAARLEEKFGGRFPEEVAAELETLGDAVQAIRQHLGHERTAGEIPEAYYRFDQFPEYRKLRHSLDFLDSLGLGNPFFNEHESVVGDTTVIDGRTMINFSAYNYVGMSGDPAVSQATKEAIDRYGTSVSASRLVSGQKPLHRELETAIAQFLGVEDSICYVGGHSTNETTIGHLVGPGDLILHDSLSHNSIMQGCLLSGATRRGFPHNDYAALEALLQEMRHEYRRVLIVVEGVYSMDGDIAPLPQFIDIKQRHKALLMVDEAHSIGVLGEHGRGISEHFGVEATDVDLWMGTLSKTFGSCGGYIAGTHALVEYLKYTAPGFVYSVGLSPPNAAAALAALEVLKREPERATTVRERARLFIELAQAQGLDTGLSGGSAVVPIIIGNSELSMRLSRAMFDQGVNVHPILYPAVEEEKARLRFFICCTHTEEQVRYTVETIAQQLARLRNELGIEQPYVAEPTREKV